jgi:hypothetical protein
MLREGVGSWPLGGDIFGIGSHFHCQYLAVKMAANNEAVSS